MATFERPDEKLRSAAEGIRNVAREADRLTQTAVSELETTAIQAAPGATLLGASVFLGVGGFSSLIVGLALSLAGQKARWPVVIGIGLLSAGGVCSLFGMRALPRNVLPRTRQQLRQDLSSTADSLR